MDNILIADGSSIGNPGPGGAAYAMIKNNLTKVHVKSYHYPHTTNNIMELSAIILGLKEYSDTQLIYTDSSYVKNGITQWIHGWKRNNWITSAKQPVKNMELWVELDELFQKIKPEIRWIKGHAKCIAGGDAHENMLIYVQNEVDKYARQSAEQQRNFDVVVDYACIMY